MRAFLGIAGIEPAIAALIGADVGNIEGCEEIDGMAEEAKGKLMGTLGDQLKMLTGTG